MRYMCLIYSPSEDLGRTAEEFAAGLPAYIAFTDEARARKAYVDAAALADTTSATTVRVRDGQRVITDGPFLETKEWLGGYFVLECASLDEAIDLAARIPGVQRGSVEIRPILGT